MVWMHMHMRKAFVDGVKPGRPHARDVVAAIDAVAAVSDQYAERSQKIENDRYLNPAGKRAKLVDFARKELAPQFAEASSRARKALKFNQSQRESLVLPKPDKSDLTGALQRQEIRGFLLDMKPSQRAKVAKQLIADPMFADAIFEMPAVMSGLDGASLEMPTYELFKELKSTRIEKLHGARLSELKDQEDDYRVAQSAATFVRGKLKEVTGLSDIEFEQFMRPLENEADGKTSFAKDDIKLDFDAIWDKAWADVMGTPPPKVDQPKPAPTLEVAA